MRRLAAGELDIYRDVRLRALQDFPVAFGSSYERESAFTDEEAWTWFDRAVVKGVITIAERNGRAVGLARGHVPEENPDEVHLQSMWVEADQRGTSTATRIVEDVCDWARERGASSVRLWVTLQNPRAIRFYERLGFTDTGERMAMERDATNVLQCMTKVIAREPTIFTTVD